jgi:cytosine/adenosine deaminase-related metal-dependent hydrolase
MTAGAGTTFIRADLGNGRELSSLRIAGNRIASLGQAPEPGDIVLDLRGDRLLPGLINAHDHLQFNSFAEFPYPHTFRNASEWIADMQMRIANEARYARAAAIPRDDRLFHGGLKNLLSGVTTVAHHDPAYPALAAADFPVRTLTAYGWAHSLQIHGADHLQRSHPSTPAEAPWIVHAAEGVDEAAHTEFDQLEALGCVTGNTLIVHGLGLDVAQQSRLIRARAGVVWCPSSNLRMFGKTLDVTELLSRDRLALGTDSRLTGARDLLDEMRVAAASSGADSSTLERLVTSENARLLRLTDRGVLRPGALADLCVIPRETPLTLVTRADIRLVVIDGRACYGDEDYALAFAPETSWSALSVDGQHKLLQTSFATRLFTTPGLDEIGVQPNHPTRKAS